MANMEKFIENLKENVDAFEDAELTPETNFVHLEEWDSIALLSVMSMIAFEYRANIKNEEILSCKTISELYELVNSRKK